MSRIKSRLPQVVILIVLVCLVPSFADTEVGAPKTGERILLIYCDFKTWPEFGYNAMETFRDALTGNNGAPDFSPKPSVDILDITSGNGIIGDLNKKFSSEIPDSLKGGNELRYWTQVYDLRFRNLTSGQNEDFITIDIDDPSSDYSLYKALLENGGGLFVQGEYNIFLGRNMGVATLINLLTRDEFKKENISDLGLKIISSFPSEPENFSTDFQDLGAANGAIALVHAGAYPMSKINYALPLISSGDNAHMLFWYSKDLKVQNGRMIVSFDINGWADKDQGSITEATYASVQNIYDLLSGVKNYTVEKSFVPDHADVGDDATFRIYCENKGKTDLVDFHVVDTVDTCLTILSSSPNWDSKKYEDGVGTILEWTIDVAKGERDSIVVDFNVAKFPEN